MTAAVEETGEALLQRPPAELRHADELAALRAADGDPRPPAGSSACGPPAASSSVTNRRVSAASSSATSPSWSGPW
nr:hypothetical protein [Streptomyces cynarae]